MLNINALPRLHPVLVRLRQTRPWMLSQLVWLLPVARSWQAAFMLNDDHEDLLILQQPIAGSQVAAEVVPGRSESGTAWRQCLNRPAALDLPAKR